MPRTACPAGVCPTPPRHLLGGYREYPPPEPVARVLEALWVHRTPDHAAIPNGASHRVLPDPALSLAFTCFRDDGGRPREPRLYVVGPVTRTRAFPLLPGFEMAAVKLKLEWAGPLLDLAPADHADALDDLLTIQPRILAPVFDALRDTRSASDAIAVLTALIAARTRQQLPQPSGSTRCAMDLARRTAGRLTVDRLAHLVGSSPRHLRRAVRREAGMTLKAYSRTVRFLHAVTTADRAARPA